MKDEFAKAIATCRAEWTDRWKRPPTTNELAHAFEITLVSSADERCADPAAVKELMFPAQPPAKLSPAYGCKVTWHAPDTLELSLVPPRNGSLRCLVERTGDSLVIDYWMSIYPEPPTDADVRRYLMKHAVPAARDKLGAFSSVTIRSVQTLADPVTLPVS